MPQEGEPNPTPTETPAFRWEFLVYLIICGALAVFFLLYFNRAFGSLLSWGIRTYTWHRYRLYIDIQALQVSLLGGRIFFTGLRYHGNNETFLIQHGYITWRYWLRRVREVDIKASAQQQAEQASAGTNGRHSNLPCRVTMSLVGLEWFIYNRSPAYDSVLAGLKEPTATAENVSTAFESKEENASLRNRGQRTTEKPEPSPDSTEHEKETSGVALLSRIGNTFGRRGSSASQTSTPSDGPAGSSDDVQADSDLPFLLQLFPIFVTCQKAAVVMGNDNTKAILIVKADGLSGEIDASKTSTPDPYRQNFKIKFQHPIVEMRENDDFKEDQAMRASREKQAAQEPSPTYKTSFFRRQRRRTLGTLRNLVPYWRKSVESFSLGSRSPLTTAVSQIPGSNQWQGLARYLDEDEQDSRLRWAGVEYAAESTVVDSPEATLTIYWDVVGKVTAEAASRRSKENAATYINGDEAPGWGMSLAINGGVVNYGPWADRHRADLQRVFVPSLSKDAVPATPLEEGAYRVPTQFKLFVELLDEVTLRIPIREDSKNWKWKGKEPPMKAPPQPMKRKQRNRAKKNTKTDAAPTRPGGWLDFIVPGNSTISFTMDMLASQTGYQMKLDVDLPSTELATSVNHELLWRSGPQRISCDLSTPLKWNTLRTWYFNIVTEQMELFILRDHVFLIIDLVDDWASGPPAEYLVFTPFRYYLNLELRDAMLYLNANDGNIINNPTDLEDNAYVVAKSPSLIVNSCIPIDKFRPSMNTVPFVLSAETFSLWLHVPPWNTQGTFLTSKEIGHGENFEVDGKYHYNATTSPANIDTLEINLSLQSPTATIYGFIIRYVLVLKDNYLGDYIHFKTLEEYQDLLRLKESNPDAELANRPPPKKSNDLDVILSVKIDDLRLLLPANLYSSQRNVQVETAGLSLDLRFTNYYMDLQVNLNPLNLSLGNAESGSETPISAVSSTQLFIDGLTIYGHRLFGLPPSEPTYMCNWDISVGTVSGECSADFLTALMGVGKGFAFEFDDDENALIPLSSVIVYDVTFLRVAVEAVRVWCHVDEAAFLFSTGTLDIKFNDWARTHYSRRADIRLPDLQVSCVNSESAMRHKWKSQHGVETDAFFQASIRVAIIGRKFHFSEERKLQQELIRREDQRAGRTDFLLLPGILEETLPDQLDPPAQGFPPVPHPTVLDGVDGDQRSFDSRSAFSRSRPLRHKSSFLSTSTASSTSSVVRPRSSVRSRAKSRQSDMLHPDGSEAKRGGQHQRDVSTSTGRHSAFYSAIGDVRDASHHSSVAFSSQFYTPPFPLESVRPDTSEAVMQSIEEDEEASVFGFSEFGLDDIDPESLTEDRAHNSIILEIPSGVTAFLNPSAVKNVSLLLAALQPSDPDDILDTLQISSMTDIFDLQKKRKIAGEITDVLVRVPKASIRFLNSSAVDRMNPGGEEQDQYDVTVSRLSLCLRSIDAWKDPLKPVASNKRTSVLLKLGSAEVSASERLSGAEENQAAFMAQIESVMVSLGSKDVTYIDADIGSIKSSTASEKIEYLASLIHRTGVVAAELGEVLGQTMSRHEDRIKHFVYKLMTEGHPIGDPSFLTRPSAVLRSAEEHLRTFDSWKMAARLRQVWTHLPAAFKGDLHLSCLAASASPPADAAQRVIDAFQRWRSWDLSDVADSSLIKNVFGAVKVDDRPAPPDLPILAALRLKDVQLLLDPGPKENRVVFSDLTTRLEQKAVPNADGAEDVPKNMTVLNVYCGEAAVILNWELCELAEDVLRLYNKSSRAAKPPQEPKSEPKVDDAAKPKTQDAFHVVLAVGRGSIEVDTINLSATSLGHNMKVSCLVDAYEKTGSSINFILSSDAVTSRLHHRSELLGMFQIKDPSIIISHELLETDTTSCHTIKSTASSRTLTFAVKQDPLYLVEVADYLVKDELTQIHKLQKQLPESPAPPRRNSVKIAERLSSFRVNVAMFLDEYRISVPLLQSMTYNISGVVARAAVAANFGKELIFDFDVKENSHEVRMDVRDRQRSISLLRIPPTNGRIVSHMGQGEHSVSVFGSVELMQLDASAVYSLLTALNRPQISSAVNELQEGTKAIQGHISELFGEKAIHKEKPSPPEPDSNLIYTIHLTLAGIEVFGNTPLVSEKDPTACLSFKLDRVHLEVANRHGSHGPILAQPELHINLRQILIDVQKGRDNAMRSCGSLALGALISMNTRCTEDGTEERSFNFRSDGLEIELSPETVSTVVAALGYMGDKIKDLDTSRELEYLRKIRQTRPRIAINDQEEAEEPDIIDSFLSSIVYRFEVRDTQISWLVGDPSDELLPLAGSKEDLILSVQLVSFGTRQTKSARLSIENFQLQMVPPGQDKSLRSLHSALLPEVVFNIAYVSNPNTRSLAFQAVGKSLDLRLTSGFIIPAAILKDSISLSMQNVQRASQNWTTGTTPPKVEKVDEIKEPAPPQRSILGTKRLESLLVDADFSGAVVYVSGKKPTDGLRGSSRTGRPSLAGKYGQFSTDDTGSSTVLRSPGLAWKFEYRDNGNEDPSLYGEIKIDASSNILYPSVVPLIMDMTTSVKEVVGKDKDTPASAAAQTPAAAAKPKTGNEDNILTADPNAVIGRLKLNLGLRICRQEFSLSCQPIARVAATTCFDDIYFTVNTVRSQEQGNFFSISGAFSKLQASVQHVYSRESTGSFDVDSIVLSLMNSKHVSGTSGVSAILKVSPMTVSINAKQLQDFLLFREIWYPTELRNTTTAPVAKLNTETSQQGHLVQRYQQVAATAAFPWTATISITSLDVSVDMGQAIGKSVFAIKEFWVSSKKTSDWEQNLCLGFEKIGIDCTGRLSGFIALQKFQLRTSIQWPEREAALNETPLVQASIGFSQFRVKAAFDYQAFLVADITSLELLMYNVRRSLEGTGDRLVAIFDGDAVQIFGTTTSAAQAVSLYQAFQKLIQERRANFEMSLQEIEKFMRRRSYQSAALSPHLTSAPKLPAEDTLLKAPISLDTDVVVTLKALNLGVFPSTFSDHQVFKMEALGAEARFAASIEQRRVHSILALTLGQLRIGLAGVRNIEAPKTLSEISVEDVVERATGSRGGTILKVPKVGAVMQTWQTPNRNRIDYIFKSAFEGKVEVGWNYSRISYIRGMWASHAKSLEQTWGKELPLTAALTAIKVTGVPDADTEGGGEGGGDGQVGGGSSQQQQKITAEVNVPQSKYDYVALEPPIIETPQLRDMGEATPPLEWIGLHRDRLPNLTHQIVIVALLELAGEVEDAYSKILGS